MRKLRETTGASVHQQVHEAQLGTLHVAAENPSVLVVEPPPAAVLRLSNAEVMPTIDTRPAVIHHGTKLVAIVPRQGQHGLRLDGVPRAPRVVSTLALHE